MTILVGLALFSLMVYSVIHAHEKNVDRWWARRPWGECMVCGEWRPLGCTDSCRGCETGQEEYDL